MLRLLEYNSTHFLFSLIFLNFEVVNVKGSVCGSGAVCWVGVRGRGGPPQSPSPPPYLRPTVVRNHEQRPELARQAGRPGDMDQRDRAGEPKQL